MNLFLKSLGVRVVRAITKEFVEPLTDERSWSEDTTKDYEANARAQYALTQALNEDDLSRIINCKSAYEVWNVLIVTHEGTSQVKIRPNEYIYERNVNQLTQKANSSYVALKNHISRMNIQDPTVHYHLHIL